MKARSALALAALAWAAFAVRASAEDLAIKLERDTYTLRDVVRGEVEGVKAGGAVTFRRIDSHGRVISEARLGRGRGRTVPFSYTIDSLFTLRERLTATDDRGNSAEASYTVVPQSPAWGDYRAALARPLGAPKPALADKLAGVGVNGAVLARGGDFKPLVAANLRFFRGPLIAEGLDPSAKEVKAAMAELARLGDKFHPVRKPCFSDPNVLAKWKGEV